MDWSTSAAQPFSQFSSDWTGARPYGSPQPAVAGPILAPQPATGFGNGFGNKGAFGDGNAAFAGNDAARNTAVKPDLGNALGIASSMGPLGAFGLIGSALASHFGLNPLGNPFNPAGPSLSPAAQAAVANSLNNVPDSVPAVVKANLVNNTLAGQRATAGNSFGGGFMGAGDPGGMGARAAAAAAGRGSSIGNGGGGPGNGGGGRPGSGGGTGSNAGPGGAGNASGAGGREY